MNGGKHLAKRESRFPRKAKLSARSGKRIALATPGLLALLLAVFTVGGTLAYLITHTEPVKNQFTPAHVSCEVTEGFDGTVKSNVNVKNTSDIEAYLRVRLVSYRVNENGQRIGGTAEVPTFTPGNGWVKNGNYYYYTQPVAPNQSPTAALIDSISLQQYQDADGGKQVIEVIAEAIQSQPAEAMGGAWGVSIAGGAVTAYTAGA